MKSHNLTILLAIVLIMFFGAAISKYIKHIEYQKAYLENLQKKYKEDESIYKLKYQKELTAARELLQDEHSKQVFDCTARLYGIPGRFEKEAQLLHLVNLPSPKYTTYIVPYAPIHKNDVLFDVGVSDLVDSTVLLSKKVGKNGLIYGFEPFMPFFESAKKQLESRNITNVKLYPLGLWNKKDVLRLNLDAPEGGQTNSITFTKPYHVDIEVVKLDDFVKKYNITKVDFIKMDIEGAELEALEGAEDVLRTQKPTLAICVYHKPEDLFQIILYLNSLDLGYKFWLENHNHRLSDDYLEDILYAKI